MNQIAQRLEPTFDPGALVLYSKLREMKKQADLKMDRGGERIIKKGRLETPYGTIDFQFRNMNLLGKRFVLDLLEFEVEKNETLLDLIKLCSTNKFCQGIHLNSVRCVETAQYFWEASWFRKYHPRDQHPSFFILWEY